MRIWTTAGLLCVIVLLPGQALPEGEGKKVVERMCVQCHGLDVATGHRDTKEGWQQIVDDMVNKGAVGTDEEIKTLVEYLAKNFGKTSSNRDFRGH